LYMYVHVCYHLYLSPCTPAIFCICVH
jgi:hypothetical protein